MNPIIDGKVLGGVIRDEKGRIVSGALNPNGKPVGTTSLKVFAREYLLSLPPEEKVKHLQTMNMIDVWKMAEGNPHSTTDETVKHIIPQPIMELSSLAKTPPMIDNPKPENNGS